MRKGIKLTFGIILSGGLFGAGPTFSDAALEKIRDGYEERRSAAMETLRGKPLNRKPVAPPVFKGGANFSRSFSYALVDFAFRSFWLGEQIEAANAALVENADYYIGYPEAYADRDSFYWAADELCRILELFGSHGTRKKSLVTPKTEERIFLMMWQYVRGQSKLEAAEWKESRTLTVTESENHHVQRFTTAWHFTRFLKDQDAYRSLALDDGSTAAEQNRAWGEYMKEWFRQRARKGLLVEMANDGYGLETLKGIYDVFDSAEDPALRDLAGKFLDLYWATWAQEQIDGVSGGAKARLYPANALTGKSELGKMGWYYLGRGDMAAPSRNLFTLVSSSYRMPLVVMDLALDPAGRGVYACGGRRLGLAEPGFHKPPIYRLKEEGGLLRTSWCTPEFIAGSFLCEARPLEDWVMISSQNRWAGVIFAGHPDARIYPQCKVTDGSRAYNTFWGVQKKGSMVFRKLPDQTHGQGAGPMQVWIGAAGLGVPLQTNGWTFVESQGAFVAVRTASANDALSADKAGWWLTGDDPYAPVLLEVARKADFTGPNSFRAKVFSSAFSVANGRFSYRSLHDDVLTLPMDNEGLPTVNGAPVDLAPDEAFFGPWVNAKWDSGVVTIAKGDRKKVLDFTR